MKKESLGEVYKEVGPFLSLGFQLAASVVGMVYLGYWLDNKYDTGSTYTLVGAVLGITTGIYQVVRVATELEKKEKNRKNAK